MTTIHLTIMLTVLALAAWAILKIKQGASIPHFSNVAEGTHEGSLTKKADAVISTRFLMVKIGSDADHIAVCGVGDRPLGIATDEAEGAEDLVNVNLLSPSASTQKAVASEAIAVGATVFTAASGKVQNEPVAAGTYYLAGRALTAAGADGEVIEIEPQAPIRTVVIATLGNVNAEIGALTIGASYNQTEVQALRDKSEELADDVRALAAALSEPSLVKVL